MKFYFVTLYGKDQSHSLSEAGAYSRLISYALMKSGVTQAGMRRMIKTGRLGKYESNIEVERK